MFKPILRSLLFSLLLDVLLTLASLKPTLYVGIAPGFDPRPFLLIEVGMVIVSATLSHVVVSMIFPIKRTGVRRLLFWISCIALGFVDGFEIAAPTTATPVEPSLPMPIMTILFWFLGYLMLSIILRPSNPMGLRPKTRGIPRALRTQFLPDEKPLYWVRQTRLLYPLTPDTLLATDQRLLIYRPTNLGFKSITEAYNYIDIATIQLNCDWFFCQIAMKERFQGKDLEFAHIPKRGARSFIQHVTLQMRAQQSNFPVNASYLSIFGRNPQYEFQKASA